MKRITTDKDLVMALRRAIGGRAAERPRFDGTDGTAGLDADRAQLDVMENPMTDVGQMLYAEEDGALAALAAPTADTQIVGAVGPDGDGKFRPVWREDTGGGPSPPAAGHYRQFVLTDDGAGGWGFVTATIAGQTWPVTALADLE